MGVGIRGKGALVVNSQNLTLIPTYRIYRRFFLREEPVLFDCLFKNTGFYDLTNNLLKQSCICTLSFQQINYNNENIENKLEYWLPGITIGDTGARQPVVISTEKLQSHIFFFQ